MASFQFHSPPSWRFFGQKRIWCATVAKNEFGSGWSSQIKSLYTLATYPPCRFSWTQKNIEFLVSWEKKSLDCHDVGGRTFFFLDWIISRSVDPSNLQDIFLKTPRMPLKTTQLATGNHQLATWNTTRKHPGCLFSKIPCRLPLELHTSGLVSCCFFFGAEKKPSYVENKEIKFHASKSRWIEPMKTHHLESFHSIGGGFF